ncbi:MAG: hypothetical protein LQ339_000740 [Xanthoria mediterranea]|nr:MAG: hypothetical protein LQ339_000740 [Xanthoria mediterranea]
MTDQETKTDLSALPEWLLEKLPLLDQPILTLCRDGVYRDNMNTLQEMDLAVWNRLYKCRKYLSSIEERTKTIDDLPTGSPRQPVGDTVHTFAEDSCEVMTKVTKAVAEAVAGLQELLVAIGRTQRRMGRILRARNRA